MNVWQAEWVKCNGDVGNEIVFLKNKYWGRHHITHPSRLQCDGWPVLTEAQKDDLVANWQNKNGVDYFKLDLDTGKGYIELTRHNVLG